MAYHYQCAGCYCILYRQAAENNEPIYSVVNGDLCSSCQSQKDAERYDDDDD
jgi:Zn-finger protein